MAVMMKGFAMKKVIKDGNIQHEEGFMGEYDGDKAQLVEVNNGKTRYTELDNNDIMKLIGVRSHNKGLEERLGEMSSALSNYEKDDTGHGSHHTRRHTRHHTRRHTRHHKRRRKRHYTKHKRRRKKRHTKRKKRRRRRTKRKR